MSDIGLIVVILLILCLIFGGIGLFVKGAVWALIIAAIFLVASIVSSGVGSGRR